MSQPPLDPLAPPFSNKKGAILSAPPTILHPNSQHYNERHLGGGGVYYPGAPGGGGGGGGMRFDHGGFRNDGRSSGGGEWEDRRGSAGEASGGYGGYNGNGGRRSRSPEFDDRRHKRPRSISPVTRRENYNRNVDEYGRPLRPRPDREVDSRSNHYQSQHQNHHQNQQNYQQPSRPPHDPSQLEAPESLPYHVTYRYFTDYMQKELTSTSTTDSSLQPELQSKEIIDIAWKKYQNSFLRKQNYKFWEEMKEKEWFREKYDVETEIENMRERCKNRGLKGGVDKWIVGMETGLVTVSLDHVEGLFKDESTIVDIGTDTTMKDSESITPINPFPLTLEDEFITTPPNPNQLFIELIAPEISRLELEEYLQKAPGFDYLAISQPLGWKNFARVGWATYNSPEEAQFALSSIGHTFIKNYRIRLIATAPFTGAVKLTPGSMNESKRIEQDLDQIRKIALSFEKSIGGDSRGSDWIEADHLRRSEAIEVSSLVVDGEEVEVEVDDKGGEEKSEVVKKTLDTYIHYLRHVFHTCYYCVCTFDFAEELSRKCPRHERKSIETAEDPFRRLENTTFLKNLDERVILLSDRNAVDPRDFGGDSVDEELHKICEPYIKHEDDSKLRCKECSKLFSAVRFVEKHIASKHSEALGSSLAKLNYFNNFVLDPAHLSDVDKERPSRGPTRPNAYLTNNTSQMKPSLRRYSEVSNLSEGGSNRNLSDRIGGRMNELEGGISMGQQQPIVLPPITMSMNGNNRNPKKRTMSGTLAPPPGMKLDPRASSNRFANGSSYADLDGAPSGEADVVLLPY